MSKTLFVIGGCRSGKSSYALNLGNKIPGGKKLFIATSVPSDEEMERRVRLHKQERGIDWITCEMPVLVPEVIDEQCNDVNVILIDCMTSWITNLIIEKNSENEIFDNIDKLTESVKHATCPVILVANEVGKGIVPENKLARYFRDIAGFANQRVAESVDKVVMVVAGIPLAIKK